MENSFTQEVGWRYDTRGEGTGGIKNATPALSALEKEGEFAGYIGFDPTAPSLHVGNLATLMLLRRLQKAGHTPYVIIGGATARVGDPAGKEEERDLVQEVIIDENAQALREQIEGLLQPTGKEKKVVILNNYDWHKKIGWLSFLREVGKHFPISYFLAKDTVKSRLTTGISYTEFSYQLLQAYDFYHVHRNHQVVLQMGGSDQWGNITTGIDLIRRKAGKRAHGFTVPLLTKEDGGKLGKTETDAIWLDGRLTSPYKFYQFWINNSDKASFPLLRILTNHSRETIETIRQQHSQWPQDRLLQKEIAEEMTTLLHGTNTCAEVKQASALLFSSSTRLYAATARSLSLLFREIPHSICSKKDIENKNVVDLVFEAAKKSLFSSKSEVRRAIKENALRLNQKKVTSETEDIPPLLHEEYLMVAKGRKNHHLVKMTND